MGNFRTKEDDVAKISTSIFVSNFPKRSKDGKRFGFVRFINVFSVERLENRGAGSWFSVLKQTPIEFIPKGRILWVEIEGVPFKLWSKNTFKKIASKWGEILDTEDQEEDGFYTKRLCIYSKLENNIYENFKVIFRGKVFVLRAKEIPGWVPEFVDELDDDDESVEGSKGDTANMALQSGGSILCVLEELVKVRQAMGYNMKGLAQKAKKDWVKELCLKNKVNFLALQETKMENMNLWCVKACWKVILFDSAHIDTVGGSSFTWCHKSATKMSKLDRFLISENLFNSFLDICAISLIESYGSPPDYLPLRESNHDYGKIPFRYFNHWAKLDGFNTFVTDTWNSAPVKSNAMRNVMQKFKFLKGKIHEWLKVNKSKNIYNSGILKEEIKNIDAEIDNGLASDTTINRRMEVLNYIQYLDKIQTMDMAQKAKVKWAIEGDENSRYFHDEK
ncbi:RNA-directed DNA polymerase, eukaryota [Tanacetum coccineum]